MYRTLTLAAAATLVAGSAFAADSIFVDLAAQDDDRAAVRALSQTSVDGDTFSTKGSSVAALEVALKHAIEDDNRSLAAFIAEKLGR